MKDLFYNQLQQKLQYKTNENPFNMNDKIGFQVRR